MDDLRETLSRIAQVESVPHAGYVRVFAIPGDCDAIAAAISIAAASGRLTSHNGTLDLGDDLPGEPSAIVRDAKLDETFAVGLGDNAFAFVDEASDVAPQQLVALGRINEHLNDDAHPGPAWQPGDTLSIYPDTLDAAKWADAFVSANFVMLITGSTRRGTFDEKLIEWFRAAIGAGYKAARPLDPNRIYIGDNAVERDEPVMPEISERDCSFQVNDGKGVVSGYDFARAEVDLCYAATGKITPDINVERDIADAAGEGMGVAGEKPE